MVNFSEPNSGSTSVNETVNGSHNFTIRGYSLTKGMEPGKYISSDTFTIGGYDWVIYFYPDGKYTNDYSMYVSVFIGLAREEVTDVVRAVFELTLLDQSGKMNHKVFRHGDSDRVAENVPYAFKNKECMWGFEQFFRKKFLETSDFLKDDCLSMYCTVGVVQTRIEVPKLYSVAIPPPDMGENIKSLLEAKVGCDVTFQVGEESFKAHKLILAARSRVFRSQFVGSTGNEKVEIEDFCPVKFEMLLDFIYSDELPEVEGSMIEVILAASERFGLDRLKRLCEAKLCEALAAETVATTLSLAEQHQCPQLKAICLRFAATNLAAVMKSEGYKHLEESCPSLLLELQNAASVCEKKSGMVSGKKRSASTKDVAAVAENLDPKGWRLRLRRPASYYATSLQAALQKND